MKVFGEGFCALSHRARKVLSLAQSGNKTSSSSSLVSAGLLPAEAELLERWKHEPEADRVEAVSRSAFRSHRISPGVRGKMRKAPFGYEASALKLGVVFGLLYERETRRLAADSAEFLNHRARTLERSRNVSCGGQSNEAESATYQEERRERSEDGSLTSAWLQFNLAKDLHFVSSFKQGVYGSALPFSSLPLSPCCVESLHQKLMQKDTKWKSNDMRERQRNDGIGVFVAAALSLWPGCQLLPPQPPGCLTALRQSDSATETEGRDNHIRSSCLSELDCRIPSEKDRLAECDRSSSLRALSGAVSTSPDRLKPERHAASDLRQPPARLLSHPHAPKSELENRTRTATCSTCLRLLVAAAAREPHCCVHDKHDVKDEMEQLGRRRHGEEGMQCRWRPKKSYKRAVFGLPSTKARRRWAASRR